MADHPCFKRVDDALAKSGTRLAVAIGITEKMGLVRRIPITTEWLPEKKKRKPPPTLVATFCPFCGELLDPKS